MVQESQGYLKLNQIAGSMSGGEQRMLEIGRSLMLEPQMVMMDEPSASLPPNLTQMIFEQLQYLNQGTAAELLNNVDVRRAFLGV